MRCNFLCVNVIFDSLRHGFCSATVTRASWHLPKIKKMVSKGQQRNKDSVDTEGPLLDPGMFNDHITVSVYFCEHMNNTDIVALQTSPVLFSVSTYQPTRLRHTFMHLQLHLADAFIKSNVHGKKNIHTHNKYCSTFFRLGKQAGAVVYNFKH